MKYTINVTEDDIKNARRQSCTRCPIANAFRKLNVPFLGVWVNMIAFPYDSNRDDINLPEVAVKFINDFDNNKEVSPFSFEVEG
jgi:hypothetical protein